MWSQIETLFKIVKWYSKNNSRECHPTLQAFAYFAPAALNKICKKTPETHTLDLSSKILPEHRTEVCARMFVYPLTSKLAAFYHKANSFAAGSTPTTPLRKSPCRAFHFFQLILYRAAIGVTNHREWQTPLLFPSALRHRINIWIPKLYCFNLLLC